MDDRVRAATGGDGRAELACGATETVASQARAGRVYLYSDDGGVTIRPPTLSAPASILSGMFGTVVADTTVTGSGYDPI